VHVADLSDAPQVAAVHVWLGEHGIRTLNVAGPRASSHPGVYELAAAFIEAVLGPKTG